MRGAIAVVAGLQRPEARTVLVLARDLDRIEVAVAAGLIGPAPSGTAVADLDVAIIAGLVGIEEVIAARGEKAHATVAEPCQGTGLAGRCTRVLIGLASTRFDVCSRHAARLRRRGLIDRRPHLDLGTHRPVGAEVAVRARHDAGRDASPARDPEDHETPRHSSHPTSIGRLVRPAQGSLSSPRVMLRS